MPIPPVSAPLPEGYSAWIFDRVIFKHPHEPMETIKYPNGEITILWQPKMCIHSAVCVKTLPKVYDPKARPWIRTENATTQELIDQVAKCPSGALSIQKDVAKNEEIGSWKVQK